MGRRLTNLVYPLLDGKQWRFIRVSHHDDNYPLKQPTPALNYVEVSQSDGIEATRINGNHESEVLKNIDAILEDVTRHTASRWFRVVAIPPLGEYQRQ